MTIEYRWRKEHRQKPDDGEWKRRQDMVPESSALALVNGWNEGDPYFEYRVKPEKGTE